MPLYSIRTDKSTSQPRLVFFYYIEKVVKQMSKTKRLNTRFSEEDYKKLKQLSKDFKKLEIEMSMNGLVNIAVKDLLKKDKNQIIKNLMK